ncbi:MAG: hypothetical protein WCS01_17100 [bacterium]
MAATGIETEAGTGITVAMTETTVVTAVVSFVALRGYSWAAWSTIAVKASSTGPWLTATWLYLLPSGRSSPRFRLTVRP